LGNFWGKGIAGRLQLGAAWWFCDHVEGIKNQLKITSAIGALGVFNGMLTDSRSFTSYPRHDYFRRILCSYIANLVDNGEYDPNPKGLQKLIVDICIDNARKYF
jgi:glucuronate isomerase